MEYLKVASYLSQLGFNHLETVFDENVLDESNVALLFDRLHNSIKLFFKIDSKQVGQNQWVLTLVLAETSNDRSQVNALTVVL